MGNRIVIIDGNSLINRAYYAMQRPMITREGIYTQGIFGFLNMLNKIETDYPADYMAVAWDRKAPTFRHEEYKEYKAGRKKMPPELAMELPLMKDILHAMSITNLEIDGFEADDIIGTIARMAEEEGMDPLIITGDKDALQLASDKTHVLITRRGISEFDLYDREKMIQRYELTPSQFVDLKGLMGDQSDNIPGIPGVGEKTGIKLLKQFGSVAELLARTDEIKNAKLRQKVEDNAQLAAMSRRLAEINTYVPLDIQVEDLRVSEPDYNELVRIYTMLEFNSFLKKLEGKATLPEDAQPAAEVKEYPLVRLCTTEDLKQVEALEAGSELVIKVFGTADHVQGSVLEGMSLLTEDTCCYIDLREEGMLPELIRILGEKDFLFVGHELSGDYYILLQQGLSRCRTAYDTAVAEYVLDPSRSDYSMKTMSLTYLRQEIPSEKEMSESAGQMDLLGNHTEEYANYGRTWCQNVRLIRELQEMKLKGSDLEKVCSDIEFPLIEVLASMEVTGICADRNVLHEIGAHLKEEIGSVESRIYELAGETFNINSPAQLGVVLFEKLELPAGKKTKRGYSTSADVLEKIRDRHEIVPLILQYRTLTKLNSTYVEGLEPLIGPDGRIHCHFQQTVAATGRLSCTEPNLQNIPVRYEIGRQLRKAFTAEEDSILIGADYSQIELRILAHLSGDENLISSFNNNEDVHRMTAARVFDIPYDEVTSLDRSRAKAVNFGVIYGMSSFGLSEELDITRKQAEQYINDYFRKHQAVKKYLDDQVSAGKELGYTETIFGRRRYIPEIKASNYMTRQFGERLAMNSPIQGTAADIIKIAMNRVFRELKERQLMSRLVLQIHDELIISAVSEEVETVRELLVRNMESAADLAVRLLCDVNEGKTWYDLKG